MSVRAYRINEIKTKQCESFNLWHDEDQELMRFLDIEADFFCKLTEGCGLTEVSSDIIKQALKKLKLDPDTKKQLKDDLKWSDANGDDYIQYFCY